MLTALLVCVVSAGVGAAAIVGREHYRKQAYAHAHPTPPATRPRSISRPYSLPVDLPPAGGEYGRKWG